MPQNAWKLTYTDVMGLCRLAYQGRSEAGRTYLLANREWTVTRVHVQGPFRAVSVEGRDVNNNNKRILSFSGSDIEWGDWNLRGNLGAALKGSQNTEQYTNGLRLLRRQIARGRRPDYLTGHSLGGGIALYCCMMANIRTATINPSPLFNDVFGIQFNRVQNSPAINYCVPYELLAAGRNTADIGLFGVSVGSTPGRRVSVSSTGGSPLAKHYLDNLVGFSEPRLKS